MKTYSTPTPLRFQFKKTLAAEIPLREAIDARKRAALATNDFERTYWRKEMRYQARESLNQTRKYLDRQRAETPSIFDTL